MALVGALLEVGPDVRTKSRGFGLQVNDVENDVSRVAMACREQVDFQFAVEFERSVWWKSELATHRRNLADPCGLRDIPRIEPKAELVIPATFDCCLQGVGVESPFSGWPAPTMHSVVSDIFNEAATNFVSVSRDVGLPLGTGGVAGDEEHSECEPQAPETLTLPEILTLEQAALPELRQIEKHSHSQTPFYLIVYNPRH